jgi:imidazolonepropionase-like amidohydrolase
VNEMPRRPTIIAGELLLTGEPGVRIPSGAVAMTGSSVLAAGTLEALCRALPGAHPVHVFPGGTVLPGLIDAHVHLALDAGGQPLEHFRAQPASDMAHDVDERAAQYLRLGVTTVRDLGGAPLRPAPETRWGHRPESPPQARIQMSGPPLTRPAGHCWQLGGAVTDSAGIRETVRSNAEAGAAVIKIMITSGRLTRGAPPPWSLQFGLEEVRETVAIARDYGLPVAAHVHSAEGLAVGLSARVDTIEHARFLTPEGIKPDTGLIRDLARSGTAVCPTVNLNWLRLGARVGEQEAIATRQMIGLMLEHRVNLIIGTDSGIPDAPVNGFVDSLKAWASLGLNPAAVLHKATAVTGKAIGPDGLGTLLPGAPADVIVVQGDPCVDLEALRTVLCTVRDGRLY